MNASLKRYAAFASMFALVAVSGCSTLDVSVANGDEGYSTPGSASGSDILAQMHEDSQKGGE